MKLHFIYLYFTTEKLGKTTLLSILVFTDYVEIPQTPLTRQCNKTAGFFPCMIKVGNVRFFCFSELKMYSRKKLSALIGFNRSTLVVMVFDSID